MPPELKWAEPLSRCAIVQPNSKSCLLTYLNQKKIIENAFLCKEVEEDCLTVTRGSFKIAFSFAETKIIMTPSVQCDQIRRNFATMSKLKNNLPIFYVLFSIWQIFDTSLVIFKPLGKFSLLQNGHIFNTLYTHLVSLSFDKKKRETLEHTNGYSRSTHKQDVPRLSLILGHLGLLHIFGHWSCGLAATYWLWSCGFESRHHSEIN